MEYILLVAVMLAAIHAYSFGRWLGQAGNIPGAMVVFSLIAGSLAVPIYRLMTNH